MVSPLPIRTLLCCALVLGAVSCSKASGSDPEQTGARTRATELLVDSGLPAGQASCIVDRLGAETVVAAGDMAVLASGQPYQDAIERCPA